MPVLRSPVKVSDGVPTAPRGTLTASVELTAVVLTAKRLVPPVLIAIVSAPGENTPVLVSPVNLRLGLAAEARARAALLASSRIMGTPPTVLPSWTTAVFLVVSTVTSLEAPVKVLCWTVVPPRS